MSRTVSRRPGREAIQQQRRQRKRAAQWLRQQQQAQGLEPADRPALPNGKSQWATVAEEQAGRQQAVEEQIQVFRSLLPTLLKRLAKMADARNPKTLKHQLTVVLLYGILTFVFQMASRCEANRRLSRPQFQENLRALFPELESCPHQDTLNRLLANIEVEQIETAHLELIQRLVRKKKFYRYLIDQGYPVAIDGTQKLSRNLCGAEEWLQREVSAGEEGTTTQYYVYVLEAHLAFANGMTIPLLSEFLTGKLDGGASKQDCELKAFQRLAARIKAAFPRLPILVLLDGLYPNGPILELCRRYHWQFMIVLQEGSLPSVWEEVEGLRPLQPQQFLKQNWGHRRQQFWWVNDIEYHYGPNHRRQQILHVVVCEESWEEIAAVSTEVVQKTSRHVWISSKPLNRRNVHERCNLGARHRWGIENNFLVEKHHGYHYQHCFSTDWKAMRGYHYLMQLGHLINVLAQHTAVLAKLVRQLGVRGWLQLLEETVAGPWLKLDRLGRVLHLPYQLRLD
ncbi:MAG: DDE transposase family protein [Acidobacteria bacterium]|nr:MAG: DDE transposase family protein [Acidobacteriota bacterium]